MQGLKVCPLATYVYVRKALTVVAAEWLLLLPDKSGVG